MRAGILPTGILINPETVFDRPADFIDALELGGQQFTSVLIGVTDHLDLGTVGEENIDVLLCDLGVDQTKKAQERDLNWQGRMIGCKSAGTIWILEWSAWNKKSFR